MLKWLKKLIVAGVVASTVESLIPRQNEDNEWVVPLVEHLKDIAIIGTNVTTIADNIHTIQNEHLPQAQHTLQNISTQVKIFQQSNQHRINSIQERINILNTHLAKHKK